MKILLTLLIIGIANLQAQTTMCFKENHNSISTIETVKLDGGECDSNYSLIEMKNQNWIIEDTKVTSKENSYNFIYILKKNTITQNVSSATESEIIQKVMLKLEEKKAVEKKEKEKEKSIQMTKRGKELYTTQCAQCHGLKGEKSAYNTSLPLNTMKLKAMSSAINSYTFDSEFGKGNQHIMEPHAKNLTTEKTQMVYEYLQSINGKVTKK